MAQLQNPGKALTSLMRGGLRAVSERWKAFLGYTQVDQQEPSDVTLTSPATLLVEAGVAQIATNERKKTDITLNDPTGKSMVEHIIVEGMAATRTQTFPTTAAALPSFDFKTLAGEQNAAG